MQEDIVEHLKQMFKPNAIILHGSRARGKEREHSDWDFVFLYNSPGEGRNGRDVYENKNIDFSSHILPITDIGGEFSTKLLGAKVVYEENGEGTKLLNQANAFYQAGVQWTPEKINDHKLWVQGRIDGMKDCINNPVIFNKYLSDLYEWVFNYWYLILQKSYSQPIYVAVDEIAEKDPEFYELVSRLVDDNTSPQEKVELVEKIKNRLFPNKL